MSYERWYDFWTAFFQALKDFIVWLVEAIKRFWEWLPKEAKVSLYMFGAVALDNWAKTIQPEALGMIPVAYRVLAFNLLEVFLVETAKRIRALAQQDGTAEATL